MKKPKYWYPKQPFNGWRKFLFFENTDGLIYSYCLETYRPSRKKGSLKDTNWNIKVPIKDYMIPHSLITLQEQHEEYNIPKKYLKDILKDIANRIML